MKRMLALVLVLLAAPAFAQQNIDANKIRLGSAPCLMSSGSGSPEGVVTAAVCSTYYRTDGGTMYVKISGTGNTGWIALQTAITPAAMTKSDDTNVTLTLGGSPSVSLLAATSLTLGWSGQLSLTRGGTGASLSATNGGVVYSGASALGISAAGNAGQVLQSAGAASPVWTTATYPATVSAGAVLLATSANVVGEDSDLSFSTDTTTATKLIAPTSIKTPKLYQNTTAGLSVGGSGTAGEGLDINTTAAYTEQRLVTSSGARSAWYVSDLYDSVARSAHINAYSGSGWMPLKLDGSPVEVGGGGFHFGSTTVTDPGLGNALMDGYLRSSNPVYASQTTGMSVDFRDGSIDARYLYTDELHAKAFIADLEQALAGGQIISKSVGLIGAAFTVPAKGSISVLTMKDFPSAPDMAIFQSGDQVRVRTFSRSGGSLTITDAWGVVTSYADAADGLQTWNFQRNLGDDGGAMADATVIPIDALALDYGTSGNGFHEVNAIDGAYAVNSPYSQIVTWSGASPRSANQTVRTRFGNLKGITGTAEYGLLAGTYGTADAGKYIIFSDTRSEIHNVPLSLYSGSNQTLYLNPVLSSFAQATSNASGLTYSTGVGCWSGIDSGYFKWRCGNPADKYISFDSSTGTLNVNGNVTVTGLIADDTNNVNGVPSATVATGAAYGALGIDSYGNPKLPAVAHPSTAALYLGSNYMGYWNGSAWKSYMNNSGQFYLAGGGSNLLSWDGTSLTIVGNITIAAGSSGYSNFSDKPTLGSLAALNSVAWATQITGIPGTLGTPAGSGLFLSSTNLGYYSGGTWLTYMDNSGRFYLGGTSGKLKWDGAALTVEGQVIASSGTIGSFTIGTYLYSGSKTAYNDGLAGVHLGSDGIGLGSAFTVSAAGALTATNATITGAITATSGSFTGAVYASSGTFSGSISASSISGGTITGAAISGGTISGVSFSGYSFSGVTISGSTISGGTITSTTLSSSTISSNTITGGTISGATITSSSVSGYCATGACVATGGSAADINANVTTISGGKITTYSIDANRLNVATLSAITANLGTVTAGTITGLTISGNTISGGTISGTTLSGSTIYAGGSNEVTLNSGGLTLTAGVGTANKLNWSDGANIYSAGGAALNLVGNGGINFYVPSSRSYHMTSSALYSNLSQDLGTSGSRWSNLWMSGELKWDSPPTTTSNDYPMVWSSGNKTLYYKTDGYDGSISCGAGVDLTVERGIVTSAGCAPEPASLRAEIQDLKSQLAELRALLLGRQ